MGSGVCRNLLVSKDYAPDRRNRSPEKAAKVLAGWGAEAFATASGGPAAPGASVVMSRIVAALLHPRPWRAQTACSCWGRACPRYGHFVDIVHLTLEAAERRAVLPCTCLWAPAARRPWLPLFFGTKDVSGGVPPEMGEVFHSAT